MTQIVNQANYTIKAAALRVNRSTRTVKRWLRDGLRCREVAGVVVIDHADLMTEFRARILANPNRKNGGNSPQE
ncbi:MULTISPECIES: hypothetical protein [Cryobacterium]|uniref:DNA-binding protein n=1 Tax=Cryobacterium breve TaxID=1259258 RepID=A0ABY2J7E5_9MICO|nr:MULTISPECIES: hypothetical protein [Cryobacterium]TFC92055.1 hypothetical protein E3T20_12130 [Cryobacterium sp. TmT3-12]TFC99806.1 hypothetical protein E3O65_05375 [Cryobacterium breve]